MGATSNIRDEPPLLLVTQPYVPAYRRPLFNRISSMAGEVGYSLKVLAGNPSGEQASRKDQVSAPWTTEVRARTWATPIGSFYLRTLGNLRPIDILVTELDPRNLNAWLGKGRSGPTRLAWGHGGNYVTRATHTGMALKVALSRNMDGVLTYTESGSAALQRAGVGHKKLFPIGNATDTAESRGIYKSLDELTKEQIAGDLRVPIAPKYYCYVGGLDSSKRLDFLSDALQHLWEKEPESHIIIGGAGEGSCRMPKGDRISYLGSVGPPEIARMAYLSSACLMPGRVGLVGIDMQALGVPLVTLASSLHGPEVAFLTVNKDIFYASDDPLDFTRLAVATARTDRRSGLPEPAVSIDQVAQNFVNACMETHGARRRKR